MRDNFGSLQANARGISSAKQRGAIEKFIGLGSNRYVVKHPLSLNSTEEKKKEVDPGTLPQLRWSST